MISGHVQGTDTTAKSYNYTVIHVILWQIHKD